MYYLRFLLLLSVLFSNIAISKNVSFSTVLIDISDAALISDQEGYLLVDLDISGVAPSFRFSKIKGVTSKYLSKEQEDLNLAYDSRVDLKNKKKGLYIMALPVGLYQITEINAPYYDLPYQLTTDNRRDWRFSIEAGKMNYIGKLFIDKERSHNYVTIRLLNHIATDKQRLTVAISDLPFPYELVSSPGIRDEFYAELLRNTAVTDNQTASKDEANNKELSINE